MGYTLVNSGCGCPPCGASTPVCETKVVVANILAVTTAPTSGTWKNSYCPGVFTVDDDGNAHTTCGAVANIVDWLESISFHVDSLYPWDTLTIGNFPLDGSGGAIPGTPSGGSDSIEGYSVTQTGAGGADDNEGSGYEAGGALVSSLGALAGAICASAQIVAMNMTGNLIVTGLNIPGTITSPCVMANASYPSSLCVSGPPYYIPMPPQDICSTADDDAGFQYAYALSQSANTEGCLPSYTGGALADCECPDPFFGSDPP